MNEAPQARRLFVAVALADAARARCAAVADELRRTGFAARYEAPEAYHLTLAFLGNVPAAQAETVAALMHGAAASQRSFTVSLDRLGGFPHERRPRAIYCGAREQGAPFRELAHVVREAYGALGFRFESDPVAHVTIARVKAPSSALPAIAFAPIALRIGALSLFESLPRPAPGAPRYAIAGTVPLSGG